MNITFDARVLTHSYFTGVENYTNAILKQLHELMNVTIEAPSTTNKLLAHIHTHFLLPFRSSELLFCPANIAPFYIPKSKKLVVTIHDVAFMRYPKSFSPLFQYYYRCIMPRIIRRANAIITISENSKNEILHYYPEAKGKLEVIPLGIDSVFSKDTRIEKRNYILYVGSLNERKNFKAVFEAFSLLHIDCQLLIVGSVSKNFSLDTKSRELLKEAKKNRNIVFKDHIDRNELIRLYNAATLLIFPSFYEGFGLPPLESMACGTPVISSNVSSMPEVCGDAALYVDPHNSKEIALAIERLFNDASLRQAMIIKGHNRVKQYSWKAAALKHREVFKKVISQ